MSEMNKAIYVRCGIDAANGWAKDYDVVQVYTETLYSVQYYDKERISGSYSGACAQVPIVIPIELTMVLMKLKKTQTLLYGETK
jgi:hypothetical protein